MDGDQKQGRMDNFWKNKTKQKNNEESAAKSG